MGAWAALANRTTPEGRAPTAGEIWGYQALRAQDALDEDGRRRHAHLTHEILRVKTSIYARLDLIDGCWQPNPRYGDRAWSERRQGELWAEIGDLLGVGPPPWNK